jgi:hypothetical protein
VRILICNSRYGKNKLDTVLNIRVHPRDKLDVGYRLSRSGLAVAYGYKNITYQGPIVVDVSVARDSSKVNVTYSNIVSRRIELRNEHGFEVCFKFLCVIQSYKDVLFRCVVLVNKFVIRQTQHG